MLYTESYKDIPERIELHYEDILRIKEDEFSVKKTIGKGGFGTVYLIVNNNNEFALKILNLWEMLPTEYGKLIKRFQQEYQIGKVENSNLVGTLHTGYLSGNPFIIMEYCSNGTLMDNLYNFKSESDFYSAAHQILTGLDAIHQHDVVHRDIKPENILLDFENTLKLTDFGISTRLNNRLTSRSFLGKAKEAFASVVWSPPEQIDENKYYSGTAPTMDIYSFGLTMYFLLSSGNTPFGDSDEYEKNPKKYLLNKMNGNGTPLNMYNSKLTEFWYNYINKAMSPNPSDRFQNASEALFELEKHKSNFYNSKAIHNSFEGASLLISNGSSSQEESISLEEIIQLTKRKIITLGRKNNKGITNDIDLNAGPMSTMSKSHATIEKINDDYYIRDGQFVLSEGKGVWNYSYNGTYINNEKMQRNSSIKLHDGDTILLGEISLIFKK